MEFSCSFSREIFCYLTIASMLALLKHNCLHNNYLNNNCLHFCTIIVCTKIVWMMNACTTEQWFGDGFSRSNTLTMMMLSPIWLQLFCKSPWGSSTAGQFFFCSHDRTIIWKPMFSFKRGGPLCREYKLLPCFRFRLKGETSWQTFPHNVFHTTIHSSYRIQWSTL